MWCQQPRRANRTEIFDRITVQSLDQVSAARALDEEMVCLCRVDFLECATTGASMVNRDGVGRVRTPHTASLWIQRHLQDGRVVLKNVDDDQKVAYLRGHETCGLKENVVTSC